MERFRKKSERQIEMLQFVSQLVRQSFRPFTYLNWPSDVWLPCSKSGRTRET